MTKFKYPLLFAGQWEMSKVNVSSENLMGVVVSQSSWERLLDPSREREDGEVSSVGSGVMGCPGACLSCWA